MRWSLARRPSTLATVVALLVVALVPGGGAEAHPRPVPVTDAGLADLPAVKPVMTCTDVTKIRLRGVTWTSATVATTGAPAPYCDVRGTIAPADTIVLRLPLNGWTRRYVQTGCGGLCGNANISYGQATSCPPIQDGTVASATTDMGHQGQNDGSWAVDHPQAVIDFAYRGVHVTAQTAKAVITRFYGHAPAYSYFSGCSDGGREALMEAQRYPHDFDGIAAGAPASNMALQNTFHHAWNVLANRDATGHAILLAARLPLVHDAVLARCDAIDGVTDGVLDDPRRCDFDPATLVCRTGQDRATCLTEAEVAVVRRLHDGATDSRGRRLEPAIAHEWGSELEWTLFVPVTPDQHVASEMFALSYLRYLADPDHPDPDYQLADLRFTVDSFWKTVQTSSYEAALDPDLSAFQRSGGKLLLWHGWNDQHISPQNTLAYYDAMRRTMGGRTVDGFAKLYLFPGMAHCGGGDGPNSTDVLTPVMAWTESGRTPARVVATNPATGVTRAVRPYVASRNEPGPGYHWVGERLFSHGYQTWCEVVNGKLVCHPRGTWLTRLA